MPADIIIRAYGIIRFILMVKKYHGKSAMKRFVDKTGKQGPASWEVGTYPDGAGRLPGYRNLMV